jgi:hypothetical protein
MTLRLEVGKSYKNRDGDIVKIVSYHSNSVFPFLDQHEISYKDDGSFREPTDGEYYLDLIEEVTECTNPKDLIGITKPPLSLIPPALTIHAAMAFKYGGYEAKQKDGTLGYGPYNWRDKSVKAMIYIDAAMRHLNCFLDGEEYAEDSKVHHLAHIAACCGILLDAIEQGNLIDDRPTKGKAAEIIKRLTLDK